MQKLSLVLSIALLTLIIAAAYGNSSKELQSDLERSEHYISASSFKKDLKNGKAADRANLAIEYAVKSSIGELHRHGANTLADRINYEYESRYKNFMTNRAVGDHEGVQWLLKIHSEIEFVLGETLCRAIRTHDLWKLAMTIPVVFHCEDKVDSKEYKLHFVMFTGVVSYWITYGVCCGASLASGSMFACGLIGGGVEGIVSLFIAPPLSPGFWKRTCKP